MWIRSQDKRCLIECNNFSVEYYTNSRTNIGSFDIETIEAVTGTYTTLGSYSTEEKALKVLDMIEGAIQQTEFPHHIYPIFQMPQDSEV